MSACKEDTSVSPLGRWFFSPLWLIINLWDNVSTLNILFSKNVLRIHWWFLSDVKYYSGSCKTGFFPKFSHPFHIYQLASTVKRNFPSVSPTFIITVSQILLKFSIIINFYHYSFWYSNCFHFVQGCPFMPDSITVTVINKKTPFSKYLTVLHAFSSFKLCSKITT